jgi:soluble lytic murein transglycosylase-like protein
VIKDIPASPIRAARGWALAVAVLGVLAATSFSLERAGAASSGGVGSPGSERESADDSGDKYAAIWARTAARDKRWARDTAECESGRDPRAIGGGGQYRGAFQFLKSTWRRAPKSPGGDPVDYPYRTQAVVAIALKNREGTRHWPVCG